MRDFERLDVWLNAHRLALDVYRVTARFPAAEGRVTVEQMRRCGISVPSNIAEGAGLGSNAQFIRHLVIASGSATELQYLLRLACDLGYIDPQTHHALNVKVRTVRRQIWALVRHLRKRAQRASAPTASVSERPDSERPAVQVVSFTT